MDTNLKTARGTPYPLGISFLPDGVNFAVFVDSNEEVTLCLFSSFTKDPDEIIIANRTGRLRHIFVYDLEKKYIAYAYRIKYNEGIQINYLSDPYSRAVSTAVNWHDDRLYSPLGTIIYNNTFDWEDDNALEIPINELIIYEMHVRGYTQHDSSKTKQKGTFLALVEKIPHLVDLGINAVELLPICEFNESEYNLLNPETNERLCQYWGYSTVNFFSL